MNRYRVGLSLGTYRAPPWEHINQHQLSNLPPEWSTDLPDLPINQWRAMPSGQAAVAIARWLSERCLYRFNTPAENNFNRQLWSFVFADDAALRQGNCQHFASATTFLLRASGHLARPVVGLRQDWPRQTKTVEATAITFQARHAHAWVEIFDDEQWQRIDPTLLALSHPSQVASTIIPTSEPDHATLPLITTLIKRYDNILVSVIVGGFVTFLWLIWSRQIAILRLKNSLPQSRSLHRSSTKKNAAQNQAAEQAIRAQDQLLNLATRAQLKVPDSWTIQQIAEALGQRYDVDVSSAVQQYHQIRFAASKSIGPHIQYKEIADPQYLWDVLAAAISDADKNNLTQ